MIEQLGALVEQSLVTTWPEQEDGRPRYGMLEPVRQYALRKLAEAGETGPAGRAHAEFFLALSERARPELRRPRQAGWLELLERENGNLRAAMSWAFAADEVETVARLGWSLWQFWWLRGHHREGRRWMEALLERELPASLRALASTAAGILAYTQGDYEESGVSLREGLKLGREVGDANCAAHALYGLGLLALNAGDLETARSRLEEALGFFLDIGDAHDVATVRSHLGTLLLVQGDYDRAATTMEEGLALARRLGDRLGINDALYSLAQVAQARGDHDGAASRLEEGVRLSGEMRDRANLGYFLESLAVVAGTRGEPERSARLFGAAEGLLRAVDAPVYGVYEPNRSLYARTRGSVRSRLGEPTFGAVWAEGSRLTFEQAVAYALREELSASGGGARN